MTIWEPVTVGFAAAASLSKSSGVMLPFLVALSFDDWIFWLRRSPMAEAESASLHWMVQVADSLGGRDKPTETKVTASHCGSEKSEDWGGWPGWGGPPAIIA